MRRMETINSGFEEKRVGGNEGSAMGRWQSQGVIAVAVDLAKQTFITCSLRTVSIQTHQIDHVRKELWRLSSTTDCCVFQNASCVSSASGFQRFWLDMIGSLKISHGSWSVLERQREWTEHTNGTVVFLSYWYIMSSESQEVSVVHPSRTLWLGSIYR